MHLPAPRRAPGRPTGVVGGRVRALVGGDDGGTLVDDGTIACGLRGTRSVHCSLQNLPYALFHIHDVLYWIGIGIARLGRCMCARPTEGFAFLGGADAWALRANAKKLNESPGRSVQE